MAPSKKRKAAELDGETENAKRETAEPNGETSDAKRKSAELDGDTETGQPSNGHSSPETEGHPDGHQESPPLIDATEVPFKLESPARVGKKKKTSSKSDIYGPHAEDGEYSQLATTYTIKPGGKWSALKPYRNFIVADNKFSLGSHVYISHAHSPKSPSDYKFVASEENTEPDFWIAKVLEVRASDQQHVYLRVFWLYWPDELPGGRQPYHGQNEVVMSNHMDMIDAMTVSGAADVRIWHEKDEDEDLPSLFFRQFYNVTEKEPLSELRRHCICNQYYNPDSTLLKCNNPSCGVWLHERCLLDDLLGRIYKRLVEDGEDSPVKKEIPTAQSIRESTPHGPAKPSLFGSSQLGEFLSNPMQTIQRNLSPGPSNLKSEMEALKSETGTLKSETKANGLKVEELPSMNLTPTTALTSMLTPPKANGSRSPGRPKSTPKAQSTPKAKNKKKKGDDEETAHGTSTIEDWVRVFKVTLDPNTTGDVIEKVEGNRVKALIEDLREGHEGAKWTVDLSCLKCGTPLE